MDRVTRKANLRKLKLPSSGSKIQQQRKTRQSSTSTAKPNTISKHFLPTDSPLKTEDGDKKDISRSRMLHENLIESTKETTESIIKPSRAKRTKLDAFVFEPPQNLESVQKPYISKPCNDDDFDVAENKSKKAPSLGGRDNKTSGKVKKSTRKKKQTTIKSAFLRNEQLFAEIAAQHCAADNFNGDDIALAIAISKSEAESQDIKFTDQNDVVVDNAMEAVNDEQKADNIRQKLEIYGFRTTEQKDYCTFAAAFMPQAKGRRLKSKWANKFTALTLRNEEQQNKKLQQKIDLFLKTQIRTKSLTEAEQKFSSLVLQSSLLRKCDKDKEAKLVNLSEKPYTSSELYFVDELFAISKLPAGHLLKDWTAIQGRDLTPKRKSKCSNGMQARIREIYKELEEYFMNLKDGFNESIKEKPQSTQREEDESKNIQENPKTEKDIYKTTDLAECSSISKRERKSHEYPPTSTDTTLSEIIREVVPSTKDLDLMQVSAYAMSTKSSEQILQEIPKNNLQEIQISGSTEENDQSKSSASQLSEISFKSSYINHITPAIHLDLVEVSDTCLSQKCVKGESLGINQDNMLNNKEKENEVKNTVATLCYHSEDINTSMSSKISQSQTELMKLSNYSLGAEDMSAFCKETIHHTKSTDKEHKQQIYDKNKTSETAFESNAILKLNILDPIPVSCISVPTQNTIDNTQNNRSNSPDLFADSDIEMEDDLNKDSGSTSNLSEDKNNSYKGLTTYEIYSSDEVKNSPFLLRPNSPMHLSRQAENIIDLTQNDFERSAQTKILNQCKSIVEIDIFSDSPQSNDDDINSNIQQSEYIKTETDETLKYSLSPYGNALQSASKKFTFDTEIKNYDDEDMELNQTEKYLLNVPESKQLETSFHRQTANIVQEKLKKSKKSKSISPKIYAKKDDDDEILFQELYNKYLGNKNRRTSKINNQTDNSILRKSFTQVETSFISSKQRAYDTEFNMDVNDTRKVQSFSSKTPEQMRSNIRSCQLSKSQSFNATNISIDLTQIEENEIVGRGNNVVDDDDDDDEECLMLSDDEINYSIWNANKIDQENDVNGKDLEFEISIAKPENFEFLELNEKKLSLTRFSKSSDLMQSKLPTSQQLEDNHLERSCFGIMEEFSQHIDYAPMEQDISFLQSPSERTEPMKKFSSCRGSLNPLNKLIHHIEDNGTPFPNNVQDDYEEFQLENNQTNTSNLKCVPQGIEQLLTAEISFEERTKIQRTFSIDYDEFKHDDISNNKLPKSSEKEKSSLSFNSKEDTQQITINNKTYTIRHCQTQKPDYMLYSEAELLKELYNNGIKPLKRKQAIKMLEYIYIQTHPMIVEDKATENINESYENLNDINLASTSKTSACNISLSPKGPVDLSQNYLNTQNSINNKNQKKGNLTNESGKKLSLHDGSGLDMLRYSFDLKAELADEQYILQTNVTKKTPQPLMPLHIAWYNLVCCNSNLHEMILMYEPIDLQEVYLFLKGLGYRYDPKDLKQFFDRRCIIFRYDLAAAGSSDPSKSKNNNRHVRKKKTALKMK